MSKSNMDDVKYPVTTASYRFKDNGKGKCPIKDCDIE